MPIRTAAWSCEYCDDIKITKEKAEQHERACWHNPKNRTCFSCHFTTLTMNPGHYSISARDAVRSVDTQTRTIKAGSHGPGAQIGRGQYTSRSSTVRGVADKG